MKNIFPKTFFLSLAPGIFSVLILLTNNIRDFTNDAKNKKKTLVVKIGIPHSKILYIMLNILLISLPFFLYQYWDKGVFVTLFIFPLLIISIKKLNSYQKLQDLNQLLALNSITLFLFCILFILGLHLHKFMF